LGENEKVDVMFAQLVLQFQSAAQIQLGLSENPQTKKNEKNLQQAKYFIDMLNMIQKKTSGNLSEEESKLLNSTVANLKMNFVSACNEAGIQTKSKKE